MQRSIENLLLVDMETAARWASNYIKRQVSVSNISYLIQYGRVNKYCSNSKILVNLEELKAYYDNTLNLNRVDKHEDINWRLSFNEYRESERTKHVHRLHPYKGKFIPQLVEYFLDQHTDEFKKEVFFREGDIILDPFCGSGTTLVQANELGINAIGIDISFFNCLISNVKVRKYNMSKVYEAIRDITKKFKNFLRDKSYIDFDKELADKLNSFNQEHFPSPEYKINIRRGFINEIEYGKKKEREFLDIYNELMQKYSIEVVQDKHDKPFLSVWYVRPVREELEFLAQLIREIPDSYVKDLMVTILSRTARSCRATSHADLATLKKPVYEPYYCRKHGKICKPIYSCFKWWDFYTKDTIKRLLEFEKLRTNTKQLCITGDSRSIDILEEVKKIDKDFAELIKNRGIKGIFTSPPYIGLIDYHEQHAYSYELFDFERRDELEIGSMSKGKDKKSIENYMKDMVHVFENCSKYLREDAEIFIVVNDNYSLYQEIIDKAGMKVIQEYKRPVLCRVEKNRNQLYTESIFHARRITYG